MSGKTKYKINHNYFSIIDTEEKAYWLGFLLADGYVTKQKYSHYLGLSLEIKDLSHIEKLKQALQSTHPINIYKSKTAYSEVIYARFLISSKQLVSDLEKYQLIENKSLILKYPDNLESHLNIPLIRGYIDGDGSWAITNRNKIGFTLKVYGTENILNNICKHLSIGPYKLSKRYDDNKNNYYFTVNGTKQVYRIMNLLYNNASIFLERKYQRYLLAQSRFEVIQK